MAKFHQQSYPPSPQSPRNAMKPGSLDAEVITMLRAHRLQQEELQRNMVLKEQVGKEILARNASAQSKDAANGPEKEKASDSEPENDDQGGPHDDHPSLTLKIESAAGDRVGALAMNSPRYSGNNSYIDMISIIPQDNSAGNSVAPSRDVSAAPSPFLGGIKISLSQGFPSAILYSRDSESSEMSEHFQLTYPSLDAALNGEKLTEHRNPLSGGGEPYQSGESSPLHREPGDDDAQAGYQSGDGASTPQTPFSEGEGEPAGAAPEQLEEGELPPLALGEGEERSIELIGDPPDELVKV